jgi:prolyl-tRNA synthetase
MAKASQLFIPTLREDPGDAEAASHRLLVRGGFIRQVSAGLWSFLPLGWRVHEKAVQIVREEMNAIGGQEMFMPVVTPAELWQASGRYVIPELWKTDDRLGRHFVLAMTHEETVTFHAREISSYRQLPQILYHFQTKVRDEPRPRGGLIRVREFIMKDAYSFDRDDEGLERSFRAHEGAYHRIFERCGLEYYAVQAESGMMGGSASVDFLAPSASGENTLVTCENGDYAADLEVARGIPRAPEFPERLDVPTEVETPGVTTIEALADFLGIDAAATSKAMPVVRQDGTLVLALVRGDDRLEEAKTTAALGSGFRPATEEEIREAFGADPGSLGPIGFGGPILADETLREGQFVAGANRPAGTCAASSTAATSRRRSPTSASRARAMPARGAAAASAFGRRSRSGTSSSSTRTTRSRSTPPSWRRTAPSAPSSWAATASGPGGSWPRPSSSGTTSTASPGRAPWLRTRSRSSPSGRPGPKRSRSPSAPRVTSRPPGSRCSSTTATCARERSSPMPTCSAAPSGSRSGRRPSRTGASTCCGGRTARRSAFRSSPLSTT